MSARTKRVLVEARSALSAVDMPRPASRARHRGRTDQGAFYHHYRSKEEILLEIHDNFIDEQIGRARAAVGLAGRRRVAEAADPLGDAGDLGTPGRR